MLNLTRTIYLFTVGLGIITVLFMLIQVRIILKKGMIERRARRQPITRADSRRLYWGLVIGVLLGSAGITWGLVLIASRIFGL
jgi:hypothetical protein